MAQEEPKEKWLQIGPNWDNFYNSLTHKVFRMDYY